MGLHRRCMVFRPLCEKNMICTQNLYNQACRGLVMMSLCTGYPLLARKGLASFLGNSINTRCSKCLRLGLRKNLHRVMFMR